MYNLYEYNNLSYIQPLDKERDTLTNERNQTNNLIERELERHDEAWWFDVACADGSDET